MRANFVDRREAGRRLGHAVQSLAISGEDALVLGLPRGGVPVAQEVALAIGAPLDVLMVKKMGVPGQRELAAGAVADGSHPVVIFNREILAETGLSEQDLEPVKEEALRELRQREAVLRGGRAPVPVTGKTVIVVDDGLATGSTARAAGLVLMQRGAARTVLAVPLAPADTVEEMRGVYDEVVCLVCPRPFWSVGSHYDDFSQVSDVEVIGMLEDARSGVHRGGAEGAEGAQGDGA